MDKFCFRVFEPSENAIFEVVEIDIENPSDPIITYLKRYNYYTTYDGVLLRSTGIKDDKGNTIFEGDIVRRNDLNSFNGDFVGVVRMLEGTWVIDNPKHNMCINLWTEADTNSIIGNRFTNTKEMENILNG